MVVVHCKLLDYQGVNPNSSFQFPKRIQTIESSHSLLAYFSHILVIFYFSIQ